MHYHPLQGFHLNHACKGCEDRLFLVFLSLFFFFLFLVALSLLALLALSLFFLRALLSFVLFLSSLSLFFLFAFSSLALLALALFYLRPLAIFSLLALSLVLFFPHFLQCSFLHFSLSCHASSHIFFSAFFCIFFLPLCLLLSFYFELLTNTPFHPFQVYNVILEFLKSHVLSVLIKTLIIFVSITFTLGAPNSICFIFWQ